MVEIKSTALRFAYRDGLKKDGDTKYAYNTLSNINPNIADDTVISLIDIFGKLQSESAGTVDKAVVQTFRKDSENTEEDEEI